VCIGYVTIVGVLLCALGLCLYRPLTAIILWDRVKVAFAPTPPFPLTQQQKEEDFLFLYDFPKDSYP